MWLFIKQIFTWWNGETIGTRFMTYFRGKKVGEDDQGNMYYEDKKGRRWVIYNGYAEASKVPADWHGWLHRSFDNRPGHEPLKKYDWELSHIPNQTGTVNAYAPKGSMFHEPQPADKNMAQDYEAWKPDS